MRILENFERKVPAFVKYRKEQLSPLNREMNTQVIAYSRGDRVFSKLSESG